MASLKKDPEVIALIEAAVAKERIAGEKFLAKFKGLAAKTIKTLAADHGSDAKNAGNRDGAKRIMDFATDAASAVKDLTT